jgi:hypothetical protein
VRGFVIFPFAVFASQGLYQFRSERRRSISFQISHFYWDSLDLVSIDGKLSVWSHEKEASFKSTPMSRIRLTSESQDEKRCQFLNLKGWTGWFLWKDSQISSSFLLAVSSSIQNKLSVMNHTEYWTGQPCCPKCPILTEELCACATWIAYTYHPLSFRKVGTNDYVMPNWDLA